MSFIGDTQTLSIGALSLTLTREDFDGDQYASLGYRRYQKVEHHLEVSQSFYGASLIDGPWFPAKYEFEWALQLWLDDALMLDAIVQTQQENGKDQGAIPVRLVDERFALPVKSPRIRAKKGSTGITAPPGREVIWPQFDVLLKPPADFSEWFLRSSGDDLYKIKLTASELDLVPVTEDLP